jgi:hypothetical protein
MTKQRKPRPVRSVPKPQVMQERLEGPYEPLSGWAYLGIGVAIMATAAAVIIAAKTAGLL